MAKDLQLGDRVQVIGTVLDFSAPMSHEDRHRAAYIQIDGNSGTSILGLNAIEKAVMLDRPPRVGDKVRYRGNPGDEYIIHAILDENLWVKNVNGQTRPFTVILGNVWALVR
jgi:hypothetical protein